MKQYLAWVRKVGAVKWWLMGVPIRWLSILLFYYAWPASAFFFILIIYALWDGVSAYAFLGDSKSRSEIVRILRGEE